MVVLIIVVAVRIGNYQAATLSQALLGDLNASSYGIPWPHVFLPSSYYPCSTGEHLEQSHTESLAHHYHVTQKWWDPALHDLL